jgi:hypothetical protein
MTQDSKVTAIWVLALALIIVGGFLIREVSKPDSLETFIQSMGEERQAVRENCRDTSTEANRAACMEALQKVEVLLDTIQ